ncbi:MAG: hypothetical protein K2W99_04665, partial [Chthoniobacterales bacterium]|nr:hypothetical protein [Chthoniobacterales bacterium]
VGLFHAMKIMEDAISYQNSFLNEQNSIEQNRIKQNANKPPFLQFSQALNERTPSIEKNLQKLITRAKEIILLHDQRGECLKQAAESKSPIKEDWNRAAEKMTLAIESHLLYASQFKNENLAIAKATRISGNTLFFDAQSSRASELYRTYWVARDQARQEGNESQAKNLDKAADAADWAAKHFTQAAKEGISEEERDAYKQAGSYRLDQAKAYSEGNLSQAENLKKASQAADYGRIYCIKATKAGISEETRNAYKQAGSYRLDQAKALAEGNLEKATNLEKAASSSYRATHAFATAAQAGISEEERDAYKQRGSYRLAEANALAEGNLEKATNLNKAANVVDWAAEYFIRASKEGFSKEARNAYKQKGFYQLEVARLWADGNVDRANNFSYEKYLEEKNRQARQEWYQTRREPERPPVWKGLP